MKYAPNDDGITHINIFSRGKTCLGRELSNFALFPIYTKDGKFNSIEGYWYWLLSDEFDSKRELLRNLAGGAAKTLGKEITETDWDYSPNFKQSIKEAIIIKLNAYPNLLKNFKDSVLPFTHYYVFNSKIVEPIDGKWLIEYFEELRTVFNIKGSNDV